MSSRGRLGSKRLVFCVLTWVTLSCERKAPSPEECLEYAMITQGIVDQRQLAFPEVKDPIDKVVVSCLTTPYDKELLLCVKRRHASKSCQFEFRDRERRRNLPRASH